MKATEQNIGESFKVRLLTFRSFRHYGGREIQTFAHIADSMLIGIQDDSLRYIVELTNDVKNSRGEVVYKAGSKIAVCENDFSIQ